MAQESSSGCLSIPLSRALSPVAWRSWCLGLFFVASLAHQGHKQNKQEFQTLSQGLDTYLCARSVPCQLAEEKGPAAEQEELENPRGSTWILLECWQQTPGQICPHGLPIKEGEPQKLPDLWGRRNTWRGAASTPGWAQVLGFPFQSQLLLNPCLATAAGCRCSLWAHALGTAFHWAAKCSD